jgi:hypothetical protein
LFPRQNWSSNREALTSEAKTAGIFLPKAYCFAGAPFLIVFWFDGLP